MQACTMPNTQLTVIRQLLMEYKGTVQRWYLSGRAAPALLLTLVLVLLWYHTVPRLQQLANLPDITLQVKPTLLQQASEFLSKPKNSGFNYDFHHNEERACDETDILFMIPSFPENFKLRETVRKSDFYRSAEIQGVRKNVLFFFGRPAFVGTETHDFQRLVDQEAHQHKDIVQSDFVEIHVDNQLRMAHTYLSATLKSQLMLRWAATYCPRASYVIRIDDDCDIKSPDVVTVVSTLLRLGSNNSDNFVLGKLQHNDVVTQRGKYALSLEEYYAKGTYPPYITGGLQAFPMATVRLLLEATFREPWFRMEDVWINGFLAAKVGAQLIGLPQMCSTY